MKFTTVLLCLGTLYVLPSHAISVYLHPVPPTSAPPNLDASHASFALAKHLGLERFEKIGHGDGIWIDALQPGSEDLVGSAPRDGLLISMSEADASIILPRTLRPTFKLPSPSLDSLTPLIRTYLHRAPQLYSTVIASSAYESLGSAQLLNIFSAPSEANRAFLTSAAVLVDFLDRQASHSPSDYGYETFGAFELHGLEELAQQYGTNSEAYRTAVATLRVIFSNALSRSDLHLAVLTFKPEPSQFAKRADDDEPQSPFPLPTAHPAEPIGSTCFQTEDACSNATDSCSGHGECVRATKAGRTCYVCACSASVDDRGRKEEWAGTACERKDISGPFVLLTGTVVALILLVGGSVALLSSIGSLDLPSTLTGAVTGGLKRD